MITSPGDTNDLLNIYIRQLLRRTPQVALYSHDLLFGAITHRYIQAVIRIFPNCAHSYYNASDCSVTSVTFLLVAESLIRLSDLTKFDRSTFSLYRIRI